MGVSEQHRVSEQHVGALRRFQRCVTQRIGALEDHFLGLEHPLGECRVLYEIGTEGEDVARLRSSLGLDSGHLSRLLRSLEGKGLVLVESSPQDRRRRRARLTAQGLRELNQVDALADRAAESLLEPLSESQRQRLLDAATTVERLLQVPFISIEAVDPLGEDARWCLGQYYAELAERFEDGYEPANHPAPRPEELDPPRGVFLVVGLDGEPIGCGALTTQAPGIGFLTRMWVAESARGIGLGGRLLAELEARGRAFGHRKIRLDTNRVLHDAQAMYRKRGYLEVEPFNENPYSHFWFEKTL